MADTRGREPRPHPHPHPHDARAELQVIDCESAMRALWDYLDGELTEDRMHAIEAHLAVCEDCWPSYNFDRLLLDTLAALRGRKLPPPALREKVIQRLRGEGFEPR